MKCLTLTQPWASLVAVGAKELETRSWRTPYRGPLAIHAAMGFPRECRDLLDEEPFLSCLAAAYGQDWRATVDLFRGRVVATCVLVECWPTPVAAGPLSDQELAFGDSPGRFAWSLRDVVAFPTPVQAKGALGLWEWTPAPLARGPSQGDMFGAPS